MILEFINAFKNAYKEVYAEKLKSKEEIKDIKFLMHEWYERTQDIKLVDELISKHWLHLPIVQRQDYVQKTLDLIHYGFGVIYNENGSHTFNNSAHNYGLIWIYNNVYNLVYKDYENMKESYKDQDYIEVHKIYNSCIDQVNELLIKYGINDE